MTENQYARICEHCKFYDEIQDGPWSYGQCRRYPPKNSLKKDKQKEPYPLILPDDTCGEIVLIEETFDQWWDRVMKDRVCVFFYENDVTNNIYNSVKHMCYETWNAAKGANR